MAVLLLQHSIGFPAARLEGMLRQFFPGLAWRAGDGDTGMLRPQTIVGRTGGRMLMTCVEHRSGAYLPANGHRPPAHKGHLTISRPSTDDDDLARAVALIVGTTLAIEGDDCALLQLAPGEPWLDSTDMRSLAKMLANDPGLALRRQFGRPEQVGATAPAEAVPATPPVAPKRERAALGSFTFLLDAEPRIDWARIDAAMNVIDPGGSWCTIATPGGMGFVTGRGRMVLIAAPMPYDLAAVEAAYPRSFGFDGDTRRIARHRRYLTVMIDAPEGFADRIAVAKAATLLIGLVAQAPQVAAVFNNSVGTVFSPEQVRKLVGVLHTNEIPIALWTWVAPNSLADCDVSLTSGGLAPFLGYEVEVWNAPFPVATVGERRSEVLRYLLINGPVIAHGDTIGTSKADQSTRCFFGNSRADRRDPVKAMFVEFDIPGSRRPVKDLPAPTPPSPPQPVAAGPFRRVANFGRKRA